MSEVSKIEIPVEAATAAALSDTRKRAAVGRLIDHWSGQVRTTRSSPSLSERHRRRERPG
jgi:hypothetical protein